MRTFGPLGLVALLVLMGPNCRSMPPVPSLPDLTAFEPSVQEQLRSAHAALVSVSTRRAGSAAEAEAYGRLGSLLLASDDLRNAEQFLLKAQSLSPLDIRWAYYLAHLCRGRGDFAKAAKWFEQARSIRPADLATLVWLGRVYVDAGQPEAAEPILKKALEVAPGSAAALGAMGRAAFARDDYTQAAAYLEGALTVFPGASALQYPLAMAYRGLGDASKAEAHLRKRGDVDVRPEDPLMRELDSLLESPVRSERLGLEALEKGLWADGEQHFRKGIALRPAEPDLRAALSHGLGSALALSGDAAAAQVQFEEGVQASPTYWKNHYDLGVLAAMAGRDASAIAYFTEVVKLEPDYAPAHLMLADTLRRTAQVDASLVEYREVLRIDPKIAEGRFGTAIALVRLDRFADATATLQEGISLHPDDLRFSHALARLLAAAADATVRDGRRALAITESLAKRGMSIELAETTAMALAEIGRYQEAAAWERRAIAAAKSRGATDVARLMAENLGLYERRQPCRTPWRLSDPIYAPRPTSPSGPKGH